MSHSNEFWTKVKCEYESGIYTVEEVGNRYNIKKGNISRKAKQENWIIKKNEQMINTRAEALNEIIKIDDYINNNTSCTQESDMIKELSIKKAELYNRAFESQKIAISLTNRVYKTINNIIDKNPDGSFIKSKVGKNYQYGHVSELSNNMSKSMQEINKIIGISNQENNIQINNNKDTNDEIVQIYLPEKTTSV